MIDIEKNKKRYCWMFKAIKPYTSNTFWLLLLV